MVDGLPLLAIDVGIVVVGGRLLGVALARAGQPAVLGEILVGIALGPSLLGAVAPGVSATLFPDETLDQLATIGGLGLSLFMFLVGLEFDLAGARRQRRVIAWIASGALVVPFACGVLMAIPLHDSHPPPADATSPAVFVIFMGTAFSLTALPVLLRIVSDRGIATTRIAMLATSSAALLDLAGWMLLTLSLAMLQDAGVGGFAASVLGLIAFGWVLAVAGRPLLRLILGRVRGNGWRDAPWMLAIVALLVGSAELADAIGLHSVLGAFLLGLLCPRDAVAVAALRRLLWPVTVGVLLPVYFVGPGFGVDIGGIGLAGVPTLMLIVVVACAGKWGGAALAARRAGLPWRDANAVGVLLNTRGIVELVVLAIGLERGVLDQVLYSELVLMALITTLMTGPLLSLLRRPSVVGLA